MTQTACWIGFNLFVLILLGLDLFVFHRKTHVIRFKEACLQSLLWISIALLFNLGIYLLPPEMGSIIFKNPSTAPLEFLTGYLVEEMLSIDNLFVFLVIFAYFKVEPQYQHKTLFWGILIAMVLRAVFILAGISLIQHFEWLLYVFGVFLIYTGYKLA